MWSSVGDPIGRAIITNAILDCNEMRLRPADCPEFSLTDDPLY
jgi:hypothetical protein